MAPKIKPRAVLYLRQSVAREESISLELQEDAGRRYAVQQGYDVIGVEADEGISGRTWNRPAVQRVMSMVDSGQVDVIVLWKWSRLSRARLDWAVALDKVEAAGGRIESATEPVDVSTSTGRLARGMLAEFAAFESERISDTWKEAQRRQVRQGLPHSGRKRFGYDYQDKQFTLNVEEAAAVAEAYRRYLDGDSFAVIADYLNSTGLSHSTESNSVGHWYSNSVISLLDNPFNAGLIRYQGQIHDGAHDPIISLETWEEYTLAREKGKGTRRQRVATHPYAGLVHCGACGSPAFMHHRTGGKHTFDCGNNSKASTRYQEVARHPGGAVLLRLIDEAVAETIQGLAQEIIQAAQNAPQDAPAPLKPTSPEPGIRRALVKASARLDSLTAKYVDEVIPRDAYERLRDEIQAEMRRLELRLKEVRVAERKAPAAVDPEMLLEWGSLDVRERRSILNSLVGRIDFWSGRPKGRVRVWTHWELANAREDNSTSV